MRLVCSLNLSFATCMGLKQHAAFDIASASSTHSAGNLVGSPAFNAQQASRGGFGYLVGFDGLIAAFSHWHVICPRYSNGSHATGQILTWTGKLHSRRTIA